MCVITQVSLCKITPKRTRSQISTHLKGFIAYLSYGRQISHRSRKCMQGNQNTTPSVLKLHKKKKLKAGILPRGHNYKFVLKTFLRQKGPKYLL